VRGEGAFELWIGIVCMDSDKFLLVLDTYPSALCNICQIRTSGYIVSSCVSNVRFHFILMSRSQHHRHQLEEGLLGEKYLNVLSLAVAIHLVASVELVS
jgi:hypothetical protein